MISPASSNNINLLACQWWKTNRDPNHNSRNWMQRRYKTGWSLLNSPNQIGSCWKEEKNKKSPSSSLPKSSTLVVVTSGRRSTYILYEVQDCMVVVVVVLYPRSQRNKWAAPQKDHPDHYHSHRGHLLSLCMEDLVLCKNKNKILHSKSRTLRHQIIGGTNVCYLIKILGSTWVNKKLRGSQPIHWK